MTKAMERKNYNLGGRSTDKLSNCHPKIKSIVVKALSYGVMDFSVIDGLRSDETQYGYFRDGKSQIDGFNRRSKHQADEHGYSHAVDLLPYPSQINGVNVWADKHRFLILAGLMYAAASDLGIPIVWGGDWDSDGNNADSNFNDMPHFELG